MRIMVINIGLVLLSLIGMIYYDIAIYLNWRNSTSFIYLGYLASFGISTAWIIIARINPEITTMKLSMINYVVSSIFIVLCPTIILGDKITTIQTIGLILLSIGGILVSIF
jgi:hypothetical protein